MSREKTLPACWGTQNSLASSPRSCSPQRFAEFGCTRAIARETAALSLRRPFPVAIMLEKLELQKLVEQMLTMRRIPRILRLR